MLPIKTAVCNFTYTAPPDMPECQDLHCYKHKTGTTSFWKPDPEELKQLMLGGCMVFTHHGGGHPVVSLTTMAGEAGASLPGE